MFKGLTVKHLSSKQASKQASKQSSKDICKMCQIDNVSYLCGSPMILDYKNKKNLVKILKHTFWHNAKMPIMPFAYMFRFNHKIRSSEGSFVFLALCGYLSWSMHQKWSFHRCTFCYVPLTLSCPRSNKQRRFQYLRS